MHVHILFNAGQNLFKELEKMTSCGRVFQLGTHLTKKEIIFKDINEHTEVAKIKMVVQTCRVVVMQI